MIMKILIALILLVPLEFAFGECFSVETKIIFHSSPEMDQEVFCERHLGQILFYVSKSCETSQCSLLKAKRSPIMIQDYHGQMGSPGFKLCRALKGTPQIVEWRRDQTQKWQSFGRCFMGDDFVEIGLLVNLWKPFINKKKI